jgi:hypothetical protein
VLETVARIPYFSAISLLHLYESLGFWRAGAELRKVHFAEEWNELHHLQIMEALGMRRCLLCCLLCACCVLVVCLVCVHCGCVWL